MIMTSKVRIQTYLKRNHVSELFEDMMSKLIQDMPSDPVSFLICFLQKKLPSDDQKFKTKNINKKFQTIAVPPSQSASLWAGFESTKTKSGQLSSTINIVETDGPTDSRKYSKPWLVNSKKDKSPLKERNKQALSNKSVDGLKTKPDEDNKEDAEDIDLRLIHAEPKVFGKPKDFADDKENELVCKNDENNNSDERQVLPSEKHLNASEERKARKQKLRNTIASQKSRKDSVASESEGDEDDALELFEVMEDLYAEGVKNPPKTGVYTSGNISHRKEQIELVLNMSKFFDSLGGAVSVSSRNDEAGSQAPVDNDDFESASQVTGPRRPVWEIPDTEVESVSSQARGAPARRLDASMFAVTNSKFEQKSSSKQFSPVRGDSPVEKTKKPRSQLSNTSGKNLDIVQSLSKLNSGTSRRRNSSKNSVVSASSRGHLERPKTAQ